MPKYIISTDGKLIDPENTQESISATDVSVAQNRAIVDNRSGMRDSSTEYIQISAFPGRTYSESVYKNIDERTPKIGDFVKTSEAPHYQPFNTFSDPGDDANGSFAFANLETKFQLPSDPNKLIFRRHLLEFLSITISSIITIAIFEFLYSQYLEDVRSKTDLTKGSHRQKSTNYLISNLFELPLQEANWPKTKTGALSSFVTGLSFDITNLNLLDDSIVDDVFSINSKLGPVSGLVATALQVIIDQIISSQDVFNRTKLRLRKISMDSSYKNFVKTRRSTVNANFGFTDFVNTYYFKYIIERIKVGDLILSKLSLGDSPTGVLLDTRLLPENALTRLAKSKKGVTGLPGNQSASALRMTAMPGKMVIPDEIQRAIALNTDKPGALTNLGISKLGSSINKFIVANEKDNPEAANYKKSKSGRIPREQVKAIEDELELEYMPFYFHDLRTNEIISFHAFIESISDSFNPQYNSTSGYGRVEDVHTYTKTTRSISVNFKLVAMNPDDHDYMWFCINKLTAMCYPQWSKGSQVAGGFTQPFSQIPTASPVIRMRLGDIFKSNYSRVNLSRLFGAGNNDFKPLTSKQKNLLQTAESLLKSAQSAIDTATEARRSGTVASERNFKATLEENNPKVDLANQLKDNVYNSQIDLSPDVVTPKIQRSEIAGKTNANYTQELSFLGVTFAEGDIVTLLPGRYHLNNSFIGQALGVLGIKNNRTIFNNTQYLKCFVLSVERSTSLLGIAFGPSDPGKSHDKIYQLYPLNSEIVSSNFSNIFQDKTILASHDSIIYNDTGFLNGENSPIKQPQIERGKEVMDDFLDPGDESNVKNPITRAFESTQGRGLAGVITQLDYQYGESLWETSRLGSKAPQFLGVQISFTPIHDIPLGTDHKGFMRAPAYPVGKINNAFFGEVYDSAGSSAENEGLDAAKLKEDKILNANVEKMKGN